jgi:hypothetical protein
MPAGEQIVEANGVELCVESLGDPAGPAVLLVHGPGHSLPAWDERFVGRLSAGGPVVVTVASVGPTTRVTVPSGRPGPSRRW